MSWFRLDDQGAFHRKVLKAGNEAYGAWCRAGQWSCGAGTDGFIPKEVATTIGPAKLWARLVEAELVETRDEGWQIHDFLDWNPSGAEQKAKREVRAAAGKLGGQRSGAVRREASNREANREANASARAPAKAQAKTKQKRTPSPSPIPDPSGGSPAEPPTAPRRVKSAVPRETPPANGPAKAPSSPVAAFSGPSAAQVAWGLWRAAYGARYGAGYVAAPADGKAVQRLADHAQIQAREHGGTHEAWLGHWFAAYLRDDGARGFLADQRHAIQFLERALPSYGLPPELERAAREAQAAAAEACRPPVPPPRFQVVQGGEQPDDDEGPPGPATFARLLGQIGNGVCR